MQIHLLSSINRWLMRIMRLGSNYVSSGSNGYRSTPPKTNQNQNTAGPVRGATRRYSACETTFSPLRPNLTTRGRRMSDSVNLVNTSKLLRFQRRGLHPQIHIIDMTLWLHYLGLVSKISLDVDGQILQAKFFFYYPPSSGIYSCVRWTIDIMMCQ